MDLKNIETEVAVMKELASSLAKLQGEPESQKRALAWLCETFSFSLPKESLQKETLFSSPKNDKQFTSPQSIGNEIAGIAMISPDNEFVLTLRDLKAKNQLDAARRLAHVSIYSYNRLFKVTEMPSTVLTALLKDWRVYDGNTRSMIAKAHGLIRTKEGGITLDAHAKKEAEDFVAEILNDEVKSTWAPGKKR